MVFIERARALYPFGFHIFPLRPGDKKPYPKTRGVKDATRCPVQIKAWAQKWPEANVGIACGEISGCVVIDVDTYKGGSTTMQALNLEGRTLPENVLAKTGNSGFHHYLRWQPGIKNSAGKIGKGIDVRSDGGYVVGPGSILADPSTGDGKYDWLNPPEAREDMFPRAPIWLTSLLSPIKRPQRPTEAVSGGGGLGVIGWLKRQSAAQGERNTSLYWTANRLRQQIKEGVITKSVAESQLTEAARGLGLPPDEAAKTIASGLNKQDEG